MQNFIDLFLSVWNQGLLGVSISQIIISLVILLIAFILRGVVSNIVIKWLEVLTAKTDSQVDDIILDSLKKPLGFIPITIGLYIITVYLPLSGLLDIIATNIVKAFVVFTIFSVLSNAIGLDRRVWLFFPWESMIGKQFYIRFEFIKPAQHTRKYIHHPFK